MRYIIVDLPIGISLEIPKVQDPLNMLDWEYIWLDVLVSVDVNPFRGKFYGSFTQNDLAIFYFELKSCYENLTGEAQFAPIEPWLKLDFKMLKTGAVSCHGVIRPDLSLGPELTFKAGTDQTYLSPALDSLEEFYNFYSEVIKLN